MNIKTVTKEEMIKAINNVKSLRELILIFNLCPNGSGGYTNIKNKILSLGLEIPKYHYYGDGKLKNKKDNDEIFVENSTFPRQKLKKRIIDDELILYKCYVCGNTGEWNNKKLSLQLDHKNGINNDNRLSNLRFLCPNCHAQTDTFSGKNNIYNTKTKVFKNRPRKVERPPYDQLISEINILGYCGTGRKYGVSDNAIRKWVKK